MEDKAEGKMKEAAGAITGDEEKKAEGRAQQRKGATSEEATQKAKTRQAEKEAREAERERDELRRELPALRGPQESPETAEEQQGRSVRVPLRCSRGSGRGRMFGS